MRLLFIIPILFLIADRITKSIFQFRSSNNPGLFHFPVNQKVLILLSIILIIFLLFLFIKSVQKKSLLFSLSLLAIILGGLSNLFDRIAFGYVIDWINLAVFPFSVFNIADISIVTGVFLIAVLSLPRRK